MQKLHVEGVLAVENSGPGPLFLPGSLLFQPPNEQILSLTEIKIEAL